MPPRLPEMVLPRPCKLLNIINKFKETSFIAVGEESFPTESNSWDHFPKGTIVKLSNLSGAPP